MNSYRKLNALFLDFDSFFASVEQHLAPELRGQPVGVVPTLAETTCCIAASYEAKAFGVKTGTGVREARERCPGIHLVESKPAEYVRHHHRLLEAVESVLHVEEALSIDELWCWLPMNARSEEGLERIVDGIKGKIAADVSPYITCSIGVGQNRWLGKMASKMDKPDGFKVLLPESLPEALFGLEFSDIHGVGKNMELRLHAHGIKTVEQLCCAPREKLHAVWGSIEGDRMWMNLRGVELPDVATERRSIGHSHVLPPEKRPPDKALAVLHRLTPKAAARLRSHGMLAGYFQISLRYVNGYRWKAGSQFEHSADSFHFVHLAHEFWDKRPDKQASILKISVVLTHLLAEGNHTPSLFGRRAEAYTALSRTIDQLQTKLGRKALHLGCDHDALETAPMRISFTHIPDLETEDPG